MIVSFLVTHYNYNSHSTLRDSDRLYPEISSAMLVTYQTQWPVRKMRRLGFSVMIIQSPSAIRLNVENTNNMKSKQSKAKQSRPKQRQSIKASGCGCPLPHCCASRQAAKSPYTRGAKTCSKPEIRMRLMRSDLPPASFCMVRTYKEVRLHLALSQVDQLNFTRVVICYCDTIHFYRSIGM